MASSLDSALEAAVTSGRLPAVGALILDKSGKTIYDRSYGTLNANDPSAAPYTTDSQLFLWSLTKLCTSLCVLQLLEQGKITSLDDPVTKYAPRTAPVLQVLERLDDSGKPILRKPTKDVTLLHLMTHTSGLTYDFFCDDHDMHAYRTKQGRGCGTYVAENNEWHFYDAFLVRDPGQQHHYGMNIDLLGFVVEEVSGLRLEEYMAKHLLGPLGLKKTGPLFSEDYLVVHMKDAEGKLTAVPALQPPKECFRRGGGHFLMGTLKEYALILQALVNGGLSPHTGQRVLKEETVRDYVFRDFIPQVGASNEGIGKLGKESLVPGLSKAGDVGYSFRNSSERGWSCGLMINNEAVEGGRSKGSGAWAGLGNI
jgi:methyl acetate hydrolase